MADKEDVQNLANALKKWGEGLPQRQRYLLMCLLSRGAYIERRVEGHVEGTTKHMGVSDIKQAVMDALGSLIRTDLPDPIEGWPRFSSWPRMGDWPRDGYWALGMGLPPKDLMHPERPDKMHPGGPETPPV